MLCFPLCYAFLDVMLSSMFCYCPSCENQKGGARVQMSQNLRRFIQGSDCQVHTLFPLAVTVAAHAWYVQR